MQHYQEHISQSQVQAKDDVWEKEAQTEKEREEMGLNLELKTFTFCAVLNAKHVPAHCSAWLSRAFGPFPCL